MSEHESGEEALINVVDKPPRSSQTEEEQSSVQATASATTAAAETTSGLLPAHHWTALAEVSHIGARRYDG
jgi:hypothetical protein